MLSPFPTLSTLSQSDGLFSSLRDPTIIAFLILSLGAGAGLALALRWLVTQSKRATRAAESARLMLSLSNASGLPPLGTSQPIAELPDPPQGRLLAHISAATAELAQRRRLFDLAATPMLATSMGGRVVFANRAAETLLGARTLVARAAEEVFTQAEVLDLHAAALGGVASQGKVRFAMSDGQWRILEIVAQPIGVEQGLGVLLTLRDVTELAQADRLKVEFVANASHELRTPLSSIKAAIETLADGAWDDVDVRERLARMTMVNIGRLEAIVRDLLDLSRLEAGPGEGDASQPSRLESIESVDLGLFIDSIAESFVPLCDQRGLRINIDLSQGPACFVTCPRLLELVLRNLIDNATKFAYAGTTVTVRATTTPAKDAQSPGLRLTVRDEGIGIPLEHQQRVFERFFQSDLARAGLASLASSTALAGTGPVLGSPRPLGAATTVDATIKRRGTGLGLAIVKHAVKSMGGTVSVESIWKQGTTMIVQLPTLRLPPAPW